MLSTPRTAPKIIPTVSLCEDVFWKTAVAGRGTDDEEEEETEDVEKLVEKEVVELAEEEVEEPETLELDEEAEILSASVSVVLSGSVPPLRRRHRVVSHRAVYMKAST